MLRANYGRDINNINNNMSSGFRASARAPRIRRPWRLPTEDRSCSPPRRFPASRPLAPPVGRGSTKPPPATYPSVLVAIAPAWRPKVGGDRSPRPGGENETRPRRLHHPRPVIIITRMYPLPCEPYRRLPFDNNGKYSFFFFVISPFDLLSK